MDWEQQARVYNSLHEPEGCKASLTPSTSGGPASGAALCWCRHGGPSLALFYWNSARLHMRTRAALSRAALVQQCTRRPQPGSCWQGHAWVCTAKPRPTLLSLPCPRPPPAGRCCSSRPRSCRHLASCRARWTACTGGDCWRGWWWTRRTASASGATVRRLLPGCHAVVLAAAALGQTPYGWPPACEACRSGSRMAGGGAGTLAPNQC